MFQSIGEGNIPFRIQSNLAQRISPSVFSDIYKIKIKLIVGFYILTTPPPPQRGGGGVVESLPAQNNTSEFYLENSKIKNHG
jgi:hypothetical protein